MSRPEGAFRPEVLAPAGDAESMRAAVRAGADAVYFGLSSFSARARATNFPLETLRDTMRTLHESGVRGYVALNTLVFDDELPALESAIRGCAAAGVDALIVQDIGVARLVREIAPNMPMHASTQMTCTDAGSVEFARSIGASRVILARELSLDDIADIRHATDMELEVFVHGALCIAYSGQCLTSEAIGGRSANRGACAQACRLPYRLVVDGEVRADEERAFLLSPEDLEASELVPRLIELGVRSLKIEGRLKGPDYVAATTHLYRSALDLLETDSPSDEVPAALCAARTVALQTYSRGSGPGFLRGVDHQRLVEGLGCDHRGLAVGVGLGTRRVRGKMAIGLRLERPLARGDGILVEGGFGGEGELGGRVWSIAVGGVDVHGASPGDEAWVWLGPDRPVADLPLGRRVFKTSDPNASKEIAAAVGRERSRIGLAVRVTGNIGEAPIFEAVAAGGARARVEGDAVLALAHSAPLTAAAAREKIGRLGGSPFFVESFAWEVDPRAIVPISSFNRARRRLVEALLAEREPSWETR
ncbi:MAG TPA: U32 family peptidase, partial [Polyangiaceae bacterium]|nr:U32 family peptidase [Polyangiaceae bacterium]